MVEGGPRDSHRSRVTITAEAQRAQRRAEATCQLARDRAVDVTFGWNHNTHYHDRLLQVPPSRVSPALDVGCGRGEFARRLSHIADHVDAIDRDAATLEHARRESSARPNITFIEADFMSWSAAAPYDIVAMVATLHHLPKRPQPVMVIDSISEKPTDN